MASADNPEERVLTENYLKIHLEALNASARRLLALHLNLEGSLLESAMINNYQGLAELVGFSFMEIKNFELQKSPTEEMLAEWTTRSDLEPTIGSLWDHLNTLERFDVLEAVYSVLSKYMYSDTLNTIYRIWSSFLHWSYIPDQNKRKSSI